LNGQACFLRSIRFVILIGATGVLRLNAYAQATPAVMQSSLDLTFDVVSIRPMKEDNNTPIHITNSTHNGYIKAVNVNLKALLEVAYDIPDTRMFGGPVWLTTGKFSLEAKADPEVDKQIASFSSEQGKQLKRKMLAALLAERFKVAVHTETREMSVYAMVIAKGGPKLGGSKANGDSLAAGNDRVEIRAGSDSLEILAYELSWRLGRPVLDRTDLQDRQALTLRWQDDEGTTADSNGPSLFPAIQEQLGLKLESTRGPVPVLLIDHAESPTEN
jgi:uncharacterized protein (TIGR03435 family)